MKHIAAYALLVLGGNENPSAADVKKVLTAAGASADDARMNELIESAKGKSFHELVSGGLAKIASAGAPAAAEAPAKEEKKAAKAEVKKEESEDDGFDMTDMFG